MSRIYTDLAVLHLEGAGSSCELVGLDLVELQRLVPVSLVDESAPSFSERRRRDPVFDCSARCARSAGSRVVSAYFVVARRR